MRTSQTRSKLLQNNLAYFGICISLQRIWGIPKCNNQVCQLPFDDTVLSLRNFHSLKIRLQMCKQRFKTQFCLHISNVTFKKKHKCREQKIKVFRRSRTLCQNNTIFKTFVLHVLKTLLAYCWYKWSSPACSPTGLKSLWWVPVWSGCTGFSTKAASQTEWAYMHDTTLGSICISSVHYLNFSTE